jgi:imidazolonepropionase-like amidohydrolase
MLFAIPAFAQTVAIRAGSVIDPATGSVAKNQIILIKGQKIADIGSSVAIPSDAQVVDLSNEWLMPGVMDAHTHITFLEHDLRNTLETNYLVDGKGARVLYGLKTGVCSHSPFVEDRCNILLHGDAGFAPYLKE